MSWYNFLIVALQSYQTLTEYQKTVVGTHPITVVEEGTIALSYRGEGLTSELSGNLGLVNGKNWTSKPSLSNSHTWFLPTDH